MLKQEFLEMQRQDLVTNNNAVLKELLLAFEGILADYPQSTDIDSSLTVEACYKKMSEFARGKAVNGCYCFGPDETKSFVVDYLKLGEVKKQDFLNLEDFI